MLCLCCFFFFFNDTATTEIYTLSLHDALPIFSIFVWPSQDRHGSQVAGLLVDERCLGPPKRVGSRSPPGAVRSLDRKSTRLNSSHANISYAVFCLKKKTTTIKLSITITVPSLY